MRREGKGAEEDGRKVEGQMRERMEIEEGREGERERGAWKNDKGRGEKREEN